jgi:ribonuclease HI
MNEQILNIFTDGGARGNPGQAATGFVIFDHQDKEIIRQGQCIGIATNNVAEYQAVIAALEFLNKTDCFIGKKIIVHFFLDSLLVVNQLIGKFKIKNENLAILANKIHGLEKDINGTFSYQFVPREKNKIADLMVNQALDNKRSDY